jgi:dephospho-CoA kinase
VFRIGLTGGIGTGKSEAARCFARLGALVIRADDVARELVAPGGDTLAALAAEFGAGVLAPDGTLDRALLARLAFASKEATARLNAIVHPPLVAELVRRLEEAEAAGGRGVVVVEAALLAEWDVLDLFDLVVVVRASLDARLARLERGGRTREDALARIGAQLPEDVLLAEADAVIENDGALDRLDAEVRRVWGLVPDRERNAA